MSNARTVGSHVVVLCSPKGGTGKSSLARHLLVSASQDGRHAIGLDFDRQGTLAKWQSRRDKTRDTYPNFVPTEVATADLKDWRAAPTLNTLRSAITSHKPSKRLKTGPSCHV